MMSFSYLERPCKELAKGSHSDHTNDDTSCNQYDANGGENEMWFNDADLKLVEKGSKKQDNHIDKGTSRFIQVVGVIVFRRFQ